MSSFNLGWRPFSTNDPGFKKRRAHEAIGITRGQEAYEAGLREDRSFYRDNFVQPTLDLRAIGLGMGAGNQFTAAADAQSRSQNMSDTAESAYSRDLERSGGISSDKQSSQQRRLGLGRIIASVDSSNRATANARALQSSAAAAGSQLYGDMTFDANQSLRAIAQAEMDRQQQYKDAEAAGKRNVMNTSAQVGAMFI